MNRVALVLSSKEIDYELSLDLGSIIPSFLPFKGRTLLEFQYQSLSRRADLVFITIPKGYKPSFSITNFLQQSNIQVIRIDHGLTLEEAMVVALDNIFEQINSTVFEFTLMYGDTLIEDLGPSVHDSIFIAKKPTYYKWGKIKVQEALDAIFAGALITSNPRQLRDAISNDGNVMVTLQKYIDHQKTEPVMAEKWLDFGHLATYYNSRELAISSRVFNRLRLENGVVTKSAVNPKKLLGESLWFQSIPNEMKIFTPSFLGQDKNSYSLAYIPYLTLYESAVFGNLEGHQWDFILEKISFYFAKAVGYYRGGEESEKFESTRRLSTDKTIQRFNDIDKMLWESTFGNKWPDIKEGIKAGMDFLISYLEDCTHLEKAGVLHGDMCSTNLFHSYLEPNIKLIDPRGIDADDNPLVFGDVSYDVAKLYQSLILGYDAILSGNFQICVKESDVLIYFNYDIEDLAYRFNEFLIEPLGFTVPYIEAKAILLLLSLIPLHNEDIDRQKAFLMRVLFLMKHWGERFQI